MKKILLVALAMLMCSVSFAQFSTQRVCREAVATKGINDLPNWTQIGTLYNLTDIHGNTINLADTLAAGKAVVIDYSAVWCSWCWVMHTNGILDAIHEQLGDDVCVLWIEADPSTGSSGITAPGGADASQGDWTNGGTVPYPIVDDANAASFIGNNIAGYPTVVFISPSGYWCDVYGTNWGFGPYDASQAVAAIRALLSSYPQAGTAPIVEINGFTGALINSTATFSANIVSVDPVTDITWTFSNGNPATATGQTAATTWSTIGNEIVTVSVTNTTGTTTATLNVNVFDYSWGNEMDYPGNGAMSSALGGQSGITWGVKYPAALLSGRNYVESVKVYSGNNGHLTLTIYESNAESPSNNDMVYQFTYPVTAVDNYVTLPLYDRVAIDATKDLWVTFSCNDISYPAAWTSYNGDPNTDMIYFSSGWQFLGASYPDYIGTWMIKTVTSATAPAMNIAINGPAEGQGNETINFTAIGPAAATYSWSFDGGNPADASGMTASTVFTSAGNHTVTLTAALDGETATATHTISIVICETQNLPWNCGFETNDDLGCWKFIDQDGDGWGWMKPSELFPQPLFHNGADCMGSASFINPNMGGPGALSPDNWLITPQIAIPAEGATISWYVSAVDAGYYQEYYSVLVSTTGSNPTDFTNTVFAGTIDNADWVKKSRSLAGFAGQTIRIAFRHHNIYDMYWMLIDDISITAGNTASIDEVNDINVALYPNPVSSKLNIVAEGVEEVNVLDINGRNVMTLQNTNTIDMSNLANGVYFVRVITANGVSTQKIVKK